jgi:hypothetical protein
MTWVLIGVTNKEANNTIQTADYENDIKVFHLLCNNFNL